MTQQARLIYRGYVIELEDGWFTIMLDGKPVQRQVTEQEAYAWIDAEKKRRAK